MVPGGITRNMLCDIIYFFFFFFSATARTEIDFLLAGQGSSSF